MINRQKLMQFVADNPQLQRAVSVIEQRLGTMPITPEMVDEIVQTLEYVLEHPNSYGRVRAEAIKSGFAGPQDLPQKFDALSIFALLMAFYGIKARIGVRHFAHGGLHQTARALQAAGRGGDTILAHINPKEAEVLRRMGGSGTVNPTTGLVEFKGGIGRIIGAVLPIAISIIAPQLIPAIGSFVSAGALEGTAAAVVGSALVGGASAALTGGNIFKGMVTGGIGAGMGDWLGANLLPDASQTVQGLVGNALAGGVAGAVGGQGALKGALQSAAGSMVGNMAGQMTAGTGSDALQASSSALGRLITAGQSPRDAILGAILAGALTGVPKQTWGGQPGAEWPTIPEPGQESLGDLISKSGFNTGVDTSEPLSSEDLSRAGWNGPEAQKATGVEPPAASGQPGAPGTSGTPAAKKGMFDGIGLNWKTAVSAIPLAAALFQTPQQAVSKLPASQQEYFNRPGVQWDWDALSRDAAAAGMNLGSYISRNWNTVTSGRYNNPSPTGATGTIPTGKAMGGPLNAVARLARGAGTGRSDTIDAKLSDGEYVMDAETVALLGDGSTSAGARKLDAMRKQIRMQKGRALARGQFSPNAKSPLNYIKEVA